MNSISNGTNASQEVEEVALLCRYDDASLYTHPIGYRYLLCIFGNIQFGIQLVGYPLLMIFGIPGQVLTIIVLFKLKNWKATCRIYYLTIAFADLFLLLNFPLSDWVYFLETMIRKDNKGFLLPSFSNLCCKIHVIWKLSSWFVSSYALVIYALERLIVISYPFAKIRMANLKGAIIICFTIAIVGFIIHVPFVLTDLYALKDNSVYIEKICALVEIDNATLMWGGWIALALTIFFPPYFLSVLNVALLFKLRNYSKQRMKIVASLNNQNNRQEKAAKDLVVISSVTIVLSIAMLMYLPNYVPTSMPDSFTSELEGNSFSSSKMGYTSKYNATKMPRYHP